MKEPECKKKHFPVFPLSQKYKGRTAMKMGGYMLLASITVDSQYLCPARTMRIIGGFLFH